VEKILCKIKLKWGKNGWSKLIIQCNSTQNQINFIYFWALKNDHCLGLFSTLLCFVYVVWIDPAHMFLRFVAWAKTKNLGVELLDAQAWKTLPTWLEKFKWDIVSVKKMVWHVPYTIRVPISSPLHCRWEKQWGYKLTILVCYHI
jgi:hypothetical protein